jgi:hypothetical protein
VINLIILLLLAQGQGLKAVPVQEKPPQDKKLQDRLEDQDDRIQELEKKLAEMEKRQAQTTSANPLTVLNPTLTVVGDFLWRFDDRKVFVDNDPALERIDDTINMREVELDLRASVDPFVDGVAILSVESEFPGDFGIAVEEFYGVVKSLPLPFWETPPLGTKIRVGRFRTEFGLNNKSHTHDLPQSDRPLVIQEFLGPEGLGANGVSAQSFLPSPGDTALEFTFQLLNGGEANISQDRNHFAFLGNLNYFVPVADGHSFNLALIGFYGTNDPEGHDQTRCASAEFLYKWKPLRQGEYNSFILSGQLFYAKHEFVTGTLDTDGDGIDDTTTHARTHPFGWDVWAQYQLSSRLYAGARWDETDTLANASLHRKQVSGYFTWYATEFFRARLTYQHTWSDLLIEDDRDTVMLELVIVFGSHPPEPFWVNK